jgi:hypothetical protein
MRRLRGVFVFLGAGPGVSFVFLFVLNVFPLSSKVVPSSSQRVPQVPNVFPKTFPIAFHFLSHIIWPCFNFHVCNLFGGGEVGAKVRHDRACFYFGEGSTLLCWGVPRVPKILVVGQSNGSPWGGGFTMGASPHQFIEA